MTVADHPTHLPDPLRKQRVRSFPEPAMSRNTRIATAIITSSSAAAACASGVRGAMAVRMLAPAWRSEIKTANRGPRTAHHLRQAGKASHHRPLPADRSGNGGGT